MNPVCFGSVSIYEPGSSACTGCELQRTCAGAAARALDALPDTPEVTRLRQQLAVLQQPAASTPRAAPALVSRSKRGVLRVMLTECEVQEIDRLPAAVARRVKTLTERGWFTFAKLELAAGRNPGQDDAMRLVMSRLLAGGCTRKQLIVALRDELAMKHTSAVVKASLLHAVLSYGGIVSGNLGLLMPAPNLK